MCTLCIECLCFMHFYRECFVCVCVCVRHCSRLYVSFAFIFIFLLLSLHSTFSVCTWWPFANMYTHQMKQHWDGCIHRWFMHMHNAHQLIYLRTSHMHKTAHQKKGCIINQISVLFNFRFFTKWKLFFFLSSFLSSFHFCSVCRCRCAINKQTQSRHKSRHWRDSVWQHEQQIPFT